jgi:predicted ArsR family transcriptional regulator
VRADTQRGAIVRYLQLRGPRTRNEIADDLGLLVSHVCRTVGHLLEEGVAECPYRRADQVTGEMNEVVALIPFTGPRQRPLDKWGVRA